MKLLIQKLTHRLELVQEQHIKMEINQSYKSLNPYCHHVYSWWEKCTDEKDPRQEELSWILKG